MKMRFQWVSIFVLGWLGEKKQWWWKWEKSESHSTEGWQVFYFLNPKVLAFKKWKVSDMTDVRSCRGRSMALECERPDSRERFWTDRHPGQSCDLALESSILKTCVQHVFRGEADGEGRGGGLLEAVARLWSDTCVPQPAKLTKVNIYSDFLFLKGIWLGSLEVLPHVSNDFPKSSVQVTSLRLNMYLYLCGCVI